MLQGALARANTGVGSVVLIGGEAGIGKSRLISSLQAARTGTGWWCWWGSACRSATLSFPSHRSSRRFGGLETSASRWPSSRSS